MSDVMMFDLMMVENNDCTQRLQWAAISAPLRSLREIFRLM